MRSAVVGGSESGVGGQAFNVGRWWRSLTFESGRRYGARHGGGGGCPGAAQRGTRERGRCLGRREQPPRSRAGSLKAGGRGKRGRGGLSPPPPARTRHLSAPASRDSYLESVHHAGVVHVCLKFVQSKYSTPNTYRVLWAAVRNDGEGAATYCLLQHSAGGGVRAAGGTGFVCDRKQE